MAKNLRKNKDFKDRDRELFMWNYECWLCGKNGWDVLHHICGGEFEEADSPLNAAPLHNYPCHIGSGHTFTEGQKKEFLNKTLEHLIMKEAYKLKNKDIEFVKKFRYYYDDSLYIISKYLKDYNL